MGYKRKIAMFSCGDLSALTDEVNEFFLKIEDRNFITITHSSVPFSRMEKKIMYTAMIVYI